MIVGVRDSLPVSSVLAVLMETVQTRGLASRISVVLGSWPGSYFDPTAYTTLGQRTKTISRAAQGASRRSCP